MNPSDSSYTPKEAAKRLDHICKELRNYNVDLEDIEVLQQLAVRFQLHFLRLESFRKRLGRWVEGFSC